MGFQDVDRCSEGFVTSESLHADVLSNTSMFIKCQVELAALCGY